MNPIYQKKTGRFIGIIALFIVLIITMFFISLSTGVINIAPLDVIKTLTGQGTERQGLVLFDFRLPGIILALLIGSGLAVSGVILQGVTQNDLADPGILGINTGAGLAVVLFIFFIQDSLNTTLSIFIMPLFALVGALFAAFLVYTLAWKNGVNPIRLVLVGIGVNAGFSAALIIFQLKMNPQDFRQATVWLSGDIWSANWSFVLALLPWILILVPYALHKANVLNVLNLGDDVAAGLGSKVEGDRRLLLLIAVALAGASVAAGGAIAFLGLVVPHIARRIIGPLHQYIIPISTLIGALLLMVSDTIGKNLLTPTEIPAGVVVAVLSTPYFVYLLVKTK
ncbi:iron complex transport system permease protein [Virgibacillus subterraneus]|uniref:Iron complex transport system permease protein n=2 Tax=Virgibacillus TaxID=84406 RepID=A0A1H1EFH9_9BACI|nr:MULTISPECIES: iron ABC transporter permease [Virgibacillus]SDQ87581.1 iron complex transport system permease protein [Virgibacillus salinus]SEQ42850.1 iron complex transport system permease protein [Virgibacillus subterraneus]